MIDPMQVRPLKPVLLSAAALLAAAGTVAAGREATRLRAAWPPESDIYFLPSAAVLRLASLGHPEIAADLVAARTNVYFGGQVGNKDAPDPEQDLRLGRFLNTIVDLDPRFHSMYLRGAAMLVYTGRPITIDTLTSANELLARGIEQFPDDWELHFQLGFNMLFELPRAAGEDHPRVPRWRQQGVEALRRAAMLEGGPSWLPSLVARMLTKEGEGELAMKHLEQAYAATNNDATREQIRRKLVELSRAHAAARLERGLRELQQIVETGYPYAPEAFSLVAGPRQRPVADAGEMLRPPSD